ncbi:MAG: hypothetical protein FWD69_14390 [Polyangiaceae bacterium]|nr:hypothetical protein [Polyangiaceae bacterium]
MLSVCVPRSVSALVACVAVAAAVACTSPTLPLPPPAAPSITLGTEPDTYHLASVQGAEPNALILVINQDTLLPNNQRVTGTFADLQGSWDLDVTAKAGDVLDISQESGAIRSAPTTIVVH